MPSILTLSILNILFLCNIDDYPSFNWEVVHQVWTMSCLCLPACSLDFSNLSHVRALSWESQGLRFLLIYHRNGAQCEKKFWSGYESCCTTHISFKSTFIWWVVSPRDFAIAFFPRGSKCCALSGDSQAAVGWRTYSWPKHFLSV